MAKVQVSNYTPESVAIIVRQYNEGVKIDAIAASIGKTVASVRAKLASLGVYAKKEAKATGKKGGVTKASIVSDIAAIVCGDREALQSLQAATLADLKSLLAFLIAEQADAEQADAEQAYAEQADAEQAD